MRPEAHRPEPVVPERNAPVVWPGHTGPIRTYVTREPGTQEWPRRLRFDGRDPQIPQNRWQWLRFAGTGQQL